MNHISTTDAGSVASVWRYPVKSMIGEDLTEAHVNQGGIIGDRSYALVDITEGKTATAKNPKKWPTLFSFKAVLLHTVDSDNKVLPVRITLPNGTTVTSEQPNHDQMLSQALKREVCLMMVEQGKIKGVQSAIPAAWSGQSEEYWPDIAGRDHRDTTTEFTLPSGTFFDAATIHLLTTATLQQLHEHYPSGHFALERFRPNIVVTPTGATKEFIEHSWIGHTLSIGKEVRLAITTPCARCVMTTLPQGNLRKDPGILRTALQQNHGNVGVYARVVQGGMIRPGDQVRVEP